MKIVLCHGEKKDFVIHKSLKSSLSDFFDYLKSTFFSFVLESNPVFYTGIISNSTGCAVQGLWIHYLGCLLKTINKNHYERL